MSLDIFPSFPPKYVSQQKAVQFRQKAPVLGKFHLAKGPFSVAPLYGFANIHLLHMGWRNFLSSFAVVLVFGSGGKQVLVYILMYLEYNTVVVLC